jgi:DNA-binding CsgD family transcriptional regulator
VALNGATRRSPLVGRAAELDALVELAQGAARGRAGARIVSGEAGVGKTALLREGCRRVADQADVLWAFVPVDDDAVISGLTPREREILTHIVAGRTYSEIARALVVSEKTVGMHVSNMLRKTGTANRVELT